MCVGVGASVGVVKGTTQPLTHVYRGADNGENPRYKLKIIFTYYKRVRYLRHVNDNGGAIVNHCRSSNQKFGDDYSLY